MLDTTFDAITRQAARISRRGTFVAAGYAGLAAFAGPVTTRAKKKKKKKTNVKARARQLARRKCQAQVEPCIAKFTQNGAFGIIPCCQLLATCDGAAFINCIAL